MSKVCEKCGKKGLVGMNVSHSHIRTKKVSNPNLQKTKIFQEGAWKRVKYCTECIKTLNKVTK